MIVPGVTSVSAASAATATPLVTGEEVLSILPGTLPPAELARRLADTDAAVVLQSWADLSASARSTCDGRSARRGDLCRAGQHRRGAGIARRGDGRGRRSVFLPGGPARERTDRPPFGAQRDRRGGRSRARRHRVDDAAEPPRVGFGHRPDRLPALSGPGPGQPGQRRHASDNTDEPARARLACELAEQGRAVAVVSSGDPGVFAMATAVLEEAKQWPGVQVRVIPAMTAAQAVASRVGAPLGHDYAVISLSDRLKPWEVIAARLAAAAASDLVLAIYNPASKSRTRQVAVMRDLLLEHRDAGTPVVIGRDVSGPAESVRVVRLADLDPTEVDMRCLLIVGSSQTQWYGDVVFTRAAIRADRTPSRRPRPPIRRP